MRRGTEGPYQGYYCLTEQEEAEHKTTKAKLADKNTIYQSIEEAKSEALKGEQGGREKAKAYCFKTIDFFFFKRYSKTISYSANRVKTLH